jgi:hypothetical protein
VRSIFQVRAQFRDRRATLAVAEPAEVERGPEAFKIDIGAESITESRSRKAESRRSYHDEGDQDSGERD